MFDQTYCDFQRAANVFFDVDFSDSGLLCVH